MIERPARVVLVAVVVPALVGSLATTAFASPPVVGCVTANKGPIPFSEATPPAIDRQSEVPALEATLAKDAAYRALFTGPRADLNAFLTYVSELMASNREGDILDDHRLVLITKLRYSRLENSAVTMYKIFARLGHFPEDFTKRLCSHLDATKNEPHLGTWTPYKEGGPVHDYSGIAAWSHPIDPAYLRAFIDAKPHEYLVLNGDGSGGIQERKEPTGPFPWPRWGGPIDFRRHWLITKEDALRRLSQFAKLTPDEAKFLKDMDDWNAQP
jgi:hypothetical protein